MAMTDLRRLLALLAVLALPLFGATACGGGGEEEDDGEDEQEQEEQEDEGSTTPLDRDTAFVYSRGVLRRTA